MTDYSAASTNTDDTYRLAMFPLSTVLYPGSPLSLHVFEPRYRELVRHCVAGTGTFGVVLIARGSEVGGGEQRLDTGTIAAIEGISPLEDGQCALLAFGTRRIRVERWHEDDPYPIATVREIPEIQGEDLAHHYQLAVGAVRRVRALLSELGETPALSGDIDFASEFSSDPDAAMWFLCSIAPVSAFDSQRLLDAATAADRMAMLCSLCVEVGDDLTRLLAEGRG
jgi:Lon protease-like protein